MTTRKSILTSKKEQFSFPERLLFFIQTSSYFTSTLLLFATNRSYAGAGRRMRPLRGRRNIVLTRGGTAIDGAELAHSAAEAYEMSGADAMVLGGQSVFRDMMPYIDRVFVTKINCRPRSDSFFENLDESSDWRITDQSEALREGDIEYSFICYERTER